MKLEMIYTQNIVLTKESCETHALALENWYVSYHQCTRETLPNITN